MEGAMRFLVCVVLAAVACGCGGGSDSDGGSDSEDGVDSRFVERAEAAESEGWTPYWLGTSFDAGGFVFAGPNVPDFAVVDDGGVSYQYVAPQEPIAFELNIVLWSRDAWADARGSREFTGKPVEIAGMPGQLLPVLAPGGGVLQLQVLLEADDTVIDVTTRQAGIDPASGRDRNPLMNEATLVSVLGELRPYPE
jgi:hypothetical protein